MAEKWPRGAEFGLAWRSHFFAPDFFARLNFAPRSSRLFFLLTSHRRRSASASEILNVAPLRSNSLDGCPSSNSESQIWRPKRRDPNPRDQKKIPGVENLGSRTADAKNPGLAAPGSLRNQRQFLEHNVFPAFGLSARAASPNGCLPRLGPRGMITAVMLDDGRRRAVDRGQLEPMNNPMHTRRRRRPRTWLNHARRPRDRCRSATGFRRDSLRA
jgi:hypothetical protein